MNLRNVAIIAHVDHGKTTLVDALLRQSKTELKRDLASQSLIMDSNELERERGITIFSKNASVVWQGTKINIVDTPGHADFGGEVERVLSMVDGCLLLVDAQEGPMPQTRFVLKQALKLKHKIIVIINKVDRPYARVDIVLNQIFDLFVELGADEESAFFPVVYAFAKDGRAGYTSDLHSMVDISPVFEAILQHIPAPTGDAEKPLQMLVSSTTYDVHRGRIAIGRVHNGTINHGQEVVCLTPNGANKRFTISSLAIFVGLERRETRSAEAGDIVAVAGSDWVTIGDTIAEATTPLALPRLLVEEPTIKMTFSVNNSPFAGKEGTFKTSRQIRERLYKELETDVALRVEDAAMGEWVVAGRGELHLAILIERLRREGYEFQVARPQVITKRIDGQTLTPYEQVFLEVPEEYVGVVIQQMGARHAQLVATTTVENISFSEFLIATRDLFGYRSEFITDTKGLGIMNALFLEYRPESGSAYARGHGSLVVHESGITKTYGLINAQERGVIFVDAGQPVYKGQVIGRNSRDDDIRINVCKEKHLTNMRSKGEDVAVRLDTIRTPTLEEALEYIDDEELVEVTPQSVRIRKVVLDRADDRRRLLGRG